MQEDRRQYRQLLQHSDIESCLFFSTLDRSWASGNLATYLMSRCRADLDQLLAKSLGAEQVAGYWIVYIAVHLWPQKSAPVFLEQFRHQIVNRATFCHMLPGVISVKGHGREGSRAA